MLQRLSGKIISMCTETPLNIAMLSIHSSPLGDLGTINTGGMSIYVRELANELSRHGHSVDIFTCAENNGNNPIIQIGEHVRLIHLTIPEATPSSKEDLVLFLPEICTVLEDFAAEEKIRYDIIHSHYWISGCLGEMLQNKWNIPHIIMFHTLGLMKTPPGEEKKESNIRIRHEKRLVAQCQKIIAPTEREKNNLIDSYKAHPDRIDIIPGGVNLDLFHIESQDEARKTLKRESNTPLLLFVGRFAALKGLELLLEALALLQEHHTAELMIIGGNDSNDTRQQQLKEHVARLHLENLVHFIGRVDHQKLPLYYNAADLVVIPSSYESFGLVCLEALACGTPVIASHVGIMPDILDGTENGATIMDPDPRRLAAAITAFLSKKRSLNYNPESVRDSVKTFSWKRIGADTMHLYKNIAYNCSSGETTGQQNKKRTADA